MRGKFLCHLAIFSMIFSQIVLPVSQARADDEWEKGVAYTKMLKDGAAAALAAVGAAASAKALAAADLAAAKLAADAAVAGAASVEAAAAVAQAEAAVLAAQATLAAATTAAEIALAVATGATIGTLIGQGLRGLWDFCWDPLCNQTFITAGNTYESITDQELDILVPELILIGTGQKMTKEDFYKAGDAGLASWKFMAEGAELFVNASRASALATAGKGTIVLGEAIPELQQGLRDYALTISIFSNVLKQASVPNPVEEMKVAHGHYLETAEKLLGTLDSNAADYAVISKNLGDAGVALGKAAEKLQEAKPSFTLVGEGGIFVPLEKGQLESFIKDCDINGEKCLPQEEILLADRLLKASGTHFPDMPSFGKAIAAYDAKGASETELAMFGEKGTIDLADMLAYSIDKMSATGSWLNIDLATSTLAKDIMSKQKE